MTETLPPPERLLAYLAVLMAGEREIDRVPVAAIRAGADGAFHLAGVGRRFAATASWAPIAGAAPHWEVSMEVRLTAEPAVDAGVIVTLRLGPADDPRWLVPGLFYGENRPAASKSRHPRWAPASRPADDPFTAASWSFRADRIATPAVAASEGGRLVLLATEPWSEVGQAGVGFGGGGADGAPVELRACFPYREEPVVYDGSQVPRRPEMPAHRWQPGASIRLAFRVYAVPAGPGAWAPALRDLALQAARDPVEPRVELAAAANLACEGLLRWHFDASTGAIYETADFERESGAGTAPGDRPAMHVAWLSGAPAAAALLAHGRRTGNTEAENAGRDVLDAISSNLAPCGAFWGQWTAEHGWGKGWTPGNDAVQTRTIAEATLFTLRAAATARNEDWLAAARSNLAFIVERQRPDGALPAAWNGRTGEPIAWEGSAALAWIPALVAGAVQLAEPALRAAAALAGERYAEFLDRDVLCGAPEDVDLGPTSEDGYVALMAYVALAESAISPGEIERWLDLARRAADWLLTFRYTWDVPFAPESFLGEAGFRTTGMDMASPANQHLHTYGLVCVPELARLARATGDAWLGRRARDHLAAARQVLVRDDGEFGGRRGMAPERYYQTGYGGPHGEIGRQSHAWCLGLLLWACEAAIDMPELADVAPAALAAGPEVPSGAG